MSKPNFKKTIKKRKKRKKRLKLKRLIRTSIIRIGKKRKDSLLKLARESGKESKRALRLLMGFKLTKEEDQEIKDLWIKSSREL